MQYLWGPLFAEAGLPPGVLNIVHTKREATPGMTKWLIEHRAIRHVSFVSGRTIGCVHLLTNWVGCADGELGGWQAHWKDVGREFEALYFGGELQSVRHSGC